MTTSTLPFQEYARAANRIGKTERRTVDGRELYAVQLYFDPKDAQGAPWLVEVSFDPQVNYLIRKFMRETRSGAKFKSHGEEQVVKFAEVAPGLYFPERIEGRDNLGDGQHITTTTAVISDTKINQPLPEGIFQLRFPPGTYMADSLRKSSYRVDQDGNPISPEEHLIDEIPPPARNASASELDTREEPRSWSRWIAPTGVVIVAFGLILGAIRRWRSRPTDSSTASGTGN
jgi:hypothetical protein